MEQRPDAQAAMMDMIKELRSNPERYRELKDRVAAAKTDDERIKVLTEFNVHAEGLRRAVPGQGEAAITTVTVTTVIIIVPSAY